MLHFDTAQMSAITQAHFFSRVAEFIRDQTTVPSYRQAAQDTTLRTALWAPHWPTLRDASEHDAALFMCFLLACATLGVDATRAAFVVDQNNVIQYTEYVPIIGNEINFAAVLSTAKSLVE